MPLFDAHCHLHDPRVAHCVPQLIQSAADAGVRWFAVNGTSEEDWTTVKTLGESHSSVVPNYGLHPWYVSSRSSDWLSNLKSMLSSDPSAAVGEVGLDMGTRGKQTDESTQIEVLKQQLELAREIHRPVSVHCVRAFGQLQHLLKEMGDFPDGVILHSFLGTAEMVKPFARHGCYFSFSGFLTSMKEQKARKMLAEVPMDRILLETDAPDALPVVDSSMLSWIPDDPAGSPADESLEELAKSKALNHPANILSVLSWVSQLKGLSKDELSAASFKNAKRVFSYEGSKVN
ncbi:hypothetical protein SELMODRAFT_169176 [Selaginella moellendorffii]|uniref:TatD related DNase n=1 Tax=Selaginella moellendorffii TaxID=88036 RepID=D8R8V9_SELML|nr:uncharacterized protein LOC9636105 isoform X1 [Selaginella moellendorffii]EFJ32128.1 hypothetical protein SELMODRAFT_169176 [Selaginella moellendorffii]|eukprot:XP_002967529.1 uncharacterized protein LOC9636105 isoform X1 [Selaginella moellendorffii]